jgi:hypothetical protein
MHHRIDDLMWNLRSTRPVEEDRDAGGRTPNAIQRRKLLAERMHIQHPATPDLHEKSDAVKSY